MMEAHLFGVVDYSTAQSRGRARICYVHRYSVSRAINSRPFMSLLKTDIAFSALEVEPGCI